MEISRARVGDAERATATDLICENRALGRLTEAEADVRLTAALGAQTLAELHALTSDLPKPATAPSRDLGWLQRNGRRVGFPVFCLAAGSVATTAATDSLAVGAISLIAGTCGVVLGRYSKDD